MPRRAATLALATSMVLGGAIALAGPATASGAENSSPKSAWYCATNPGEHKALGMINAGNLGGGIGVERNVGGRCE